MESSIYRYILRHTKRDQILLVLLTAASMPFVYLSLDVPKTIVNQAIGGADIPESILGFPVDQVSFLLIMCVVFLLLVIINGLFKYVINVYRGVVGEKMLRRFRFDLYSRLLRFPMPQFKRTSSSEVIPMITSETEPLGGFIGEAFALPAFQGGLLLTYLIFIFAQDWLLGLAAIALYPPQMWLIPKLQRKVNALAKQRVRTVRELADRVGESVVGVAEIHTNDTSRFERARVSSLLSRIFDIRVEIYKRKFFIKFLNNFLAQLTPFLFYSIGGLFVIRGELSLGALVAVIAAYKDLAPPWKELLKYYQTKEDIRVKYSQIIEQFQPPFMLNADLQRDDAQSTPLGRNLVASNLQYTEDDFVNNIDGASFRLDLEQHTAVLGKAGSGKDYMAPLVARLLQPSGGSLSIDGVNMGEMPEATVGRRIAYVGPAPYLFTGTVEDNLLYGLKNAPIEASAGEQDDSHRQAAIASGISADDPNAPWVDFSRLPADDLDALIGDVLDVLRVVGLEQDIFDLGLNGRFDPAEMPHLADAVLQTRLALRERLSDPAMVNLVEPFAVDRYNVNASLADNLRFGTALDPHWEDAALTDNPVFLDVLDTVGLRDDLVDVGRRLAAIMLDLFKDVEPGSELFERFGFISAEALPEFSTLLNRTADREIGDIDPEDSTRLLSLPFKLIVARHRLGLIDEALQGRVVEARQLLASRLGSGNAFVEFFDPEKFSPAMTVQDNILFGKVAHGQAHARERVGTLVGDTLRDLDLEQDIQRLGLRYHVGSAGSRLSVAQRQRVAIARALVKRSQLLVLDHATSSLDPASEEELIRRLCEHCRDAGILWVLDRPALAAGFDHALVMESGKVTIQGDYAAVSRYLEDKAAGT